MEVAALPPFLDWTLFWVLAGIVVIACFSLGAVYITRQGRLGLFGNIGGLDDLIVALVVFLALIAVVAPFVGLWVAGCWVVSRFSAEGRRKHAEVAKMKIRPRNVRLDQDRLERRLAASKKRAEKPAALAPRNTNPSS